MNSFEVLVFYLYLFFYYFKLLLHCLLDANNVLCALIC